MKNYYIKILLLVILGMPLLASGQLNHHRDQSLPCINKTVQVYTYIVLNEERETEVDLDTLLLILDTVNSFFAPICVKFEICAIDTVEDYNLGMLTGQDDEKFDELRIGYQKENRLNLYLMESAISTGCGFSSRLSINTIDSAYTAFTASENCLNAKDLAHEFGHVFGLYNTNRNMGAELVDGSNCETEGDEICDTPSDPFDPLANIEYESDCIFIWPGTDANGQFYKPVVSNLMSPYPVECRCSFSYDQLLKMAENYQQSNPKIW